MTITELMKPTSELEPCNPDIYSTGKSVAIITGGSVKLIERFVRELAEFSGEPVDWHYVGGRANVLTTGDVRRVQDALRELHLNIHITY